MSLTSGAAPAPVRRAQQTGSDFTRSHAYEWLARAGMMARAVTYAIVGVLAVKLALGDGGKATDQQGALKAVARQPFGEALLILLAAGLFGYAAWRLTRAAIGHGREGSDDAKSRVSGAISGLMYGALFVTALRIVLGSGAGSNNPDQATGGVLGWPGGPWLVGLAGLVVIGAGLDEGRKGITKRFCEKSRTDQMGDALRRFFTVAGVAGHLARMVVFALIGYFLVKAALDFDPDKAVALDGALAKLGNASYGPVLLGVVAAGLLAFAVYAALDARYRRI